jgi:TM2 domain-containing membrane protein YozV
MDELTAGQGKKEMKKSIKGVLLSGLVYPGLGQFILGHITTGIIFILLTTAGFFIFICR